MAIADSYHRVRRESADRFEKNPVGTLRAFDAEATFARAKCRERGGRMKMTGGGFRSPASRTPSGCRG